MICISIFIVSLSLLRQEVYIWLVNEFHLINIYSILSISSHVLGRNVHCRFSRNVFHVSINVAYFLSCVSWWTYFPFLGCSFFIYKMVMLGLCTYLGSTGGFTGGSGSKELSCQCRRCKRCRFNPWVKKISWRRAWQLTPLVLPGVSPWTEEPGRLQSIGFQRVKNNCVWLSIAQDLLSSNILY